MKAQWSLGGAEHVVAEVDRHGQETLWVGRRIVSRLTKEHARSGHRFVVAAGEAMAFFDPSTRAWRLTVAGRDVVQVAATSGPLDEVVSHHSLLSTLQPLAAELKGAPIWAWAFVIACLAMPLATLGGVIPVIVGFACAMGCVHLARTTRWPTPVRMGASAALVAVCWGVFAALLSLSRHLRAAAAEEATLPPAAEGVPCAGRKDVWACSGGDELQCNRGVYAFNRHCRGPAGCRQENGEVHCDSTMAAEGEPCIGGRTCSTDLTTELECRGVSPAGPGTWQTRLSCGSSRRCNPKTWECEWVDSASRR